MNILENLSDDDEICSEIDKADDLNLILLPPQDGQDSDCDDAPSDDERLTNFRDIGKGVLLQPLEVQAITRSEQIKNKTDVLVQPSTSSESNNGAEQVQRDKRIPRQWLSKELDFSADEEEKFTTTIPELFMNGEIIKNGWAPVDIFKLVFNTTIMEFICKESVKYAAQKGFFYFVLSVDDLYKYFGILLLSGYSSVPFRRMYWETKADTHNFLVSNSMSRNRFEQIHRFLHFNDNSTIDKNDKIFKIRPLIRHLNDMFQKLIQPLGNSFSLDEAMEPYYGHNRMKQFIRGKPIRYGYKFWCLATSDGYVIKFNPYTGAGDKEQGKSLGATVTEKLCIGFLPPRSAVFIDNYFNSLPLLDTLKNHEIFCVGTIRKDRVERAPLKDMKKLPRGSHYVLQNDGLTLIQWHDNSQVTVATNLDTNDTLSKGTCNRWSKKEGKLIAVPQPTLIQLYNKGMGGVDLFDKMRSLYRTRIRSKKWYWPLYRFCLDGSIVNLWLIYRQHNKVNLVEFRRSIALALLTSPDMETRRGPQPKTKRQVSNEVRRDNTGHLVNKIESQRRCGNCGKCTKFRCIKCNIGLHPDTCFVAYHT